MKSRSILFLLLVGILSPPCNFAAENLVQNGDFQREEDHWKSWGGKERIDLTGGVNDSKCAYIPGLATWKPRRVVEQLFGPVIAGRTYEASVHIKTINNGGHARATMRWIDAQDEIIGERIVIGRAKAPTQDFTKYAITSTAPEGTVKAGIWLRNYHTPNPGEAWFDNVSFIEVETDGKDH